MRCITRSIRLLYHSVILIHAPTNTSCNGPVTHHQKSLFLLRLLVPVAAHSVANIADLTEAIPRFFSEEALLLNRQHIRNRGRAIRWFSGGLFIMLGLLSLNFLCVHLFPGSMLMEVAGEAFVIAGWVSLWIPMERFGFDGWLLRDKLRVYTRLSSLTLEVVYET